jgi:hypothetical protein
MAPRLPEGYEVPPVSDASWSGRCAPLLELLDKPRDWTDIKEWGARKKLAQFMLRNMIAWLEEKSLIKQDPETGFWQKLRQRT